MPAVPKGTDTTKRNRKKNDASTNDKNESTKDKPKRQYRKKTDKKNGGTEIKSKLENGADHIVVDSVADKSSNDKDNETGNKLTLKKKNRPQLGMQSKKEDLCNICENPGEDLISCSKGCCNFFHKDCVKNTIPENASNYICDLCVANKMLCFICGTDASENGDDLGKIKRCTVANCGKAYHSTCLAIKMVKYEDCEVKTAATNTQFRCPLHFCDTCTISSNASSKLKLQSRSRYFKCVRCPTAYHIGDDCIAAGSVMLAGFNIICPMHFKPNKSLPYHNQIHVSWCFICSQGGKLICCASCPAAFHVECTGLQSEPEGDFYCRDCRRGMKPLYGDLIWIKLGTYRWWPGEVVHPLDIPDNIMRLRHDIGEFVVQFLGSRDYFWLNRYRIFIYQDGDGNGTTTRHCSKGISTIFKKALREADELFALKTEIKLQQEQQKITKNDKKPAPYKHIKVNRPVGKVQINTADLKEIPKCTCKLSDPKPCSAESECINHMLLYECHPELCSAGERCENQRFQKCLYPMFEVFKTSWGGWGLKAMEAIKKGNFVNEYVGELVDEEECKRRIEKAHVNDVTNYYMLTIDKDRIIDAGPKGNYSRFMNHSCDPNCETQKWTVNGDTRVGLFAKHDIAVGAELTFNYNLDCLGNDKTTCKCGAKNCSGYIGERPKPQLQNGTKKDAAKKKKRVRRMENIPQHEDLCFRCRNTGMLLVCCDFKECLKAFCLECLHITKPPYGKWECPWHHCDWCGRKAQFFCHFCPNSFCMSHVPNQLKQSVPSLYDCCLDHNPETAEFELAEAVTFANLPEEPVKIHHHPFITEMPGITDVDTTDIPAPSAAPVQLKQVSAKKAKAGSSKSNKSKTTRKRKFAKIKQVSTNIVDKAEAERCVTAVVESPNNIGGKRHRMSPSKEPKKQQTKTSRQRKQKKIEPEAKGAREEVLTTSKAGNQNNVDPQEPTLENSYKVHVDNDNGNIKSVSVKSNDEADNRQQQIKGQQENNIENTSLVENANKTTFVESDVENMLQTTNIHQISSETVSLIQATEKVPAILPNANWKGFTNVEATSKLCNEEIGVDIVNNKSQNPEIKELFSSKEVKFHINFDGSESSATSSDQKTVSEIISNCINSVEGNEDS